MIKNIQNDINKYISLENETKIIIDKLSIIHDFKHIIHINYNIHVLWNNNYEFYTKKQFIPNVKINSHFFNKINIINKLCQEKAELEFKIRKNYFEIDHIKNKIIDNIIKIKDNNILCDLNINFKKLNKYKSVMWRPRPINSLNKPELEIRRILFQIQKQKKEIICIYPQYRLPVKFKSYLFADFYLLLYINNTIYPLIIEFDGLKHADNTFIYFNYNSTKADIIKNNFAILNCISIIRITSTDDITFHIYKCLDQLHLNKQYYVHIPTYKSYVELLN